MKLLLVFSTLIALAYSADYTSWVKAVDQLGFVIRYGSTNHKLENGDIPILPVYVGVGYDTLKGNPLTNKVDPGFRNAIFDHSLDGNELTEDKLYLIPNGMKSHMRRACSFSASTSEVENTADYQSSLEVYANVAGSYGSQFSFSASAGYKEFESGSKSQNLISTLTSAQCEMYSLEMPVFSYFPLNIDFYNGALDAYNGSSTWRKFIKYFGTHFVSHCILGGRMHVQTKFEKSTYQSMKENNINVQMAAQASFAAVSGSVGVGFEKYQNDKNTYERNSDSKSEFYIGGAPPSGGNWTEWEQAVKNDLAPISYTLNFIGDLFTSKYFEDVPAEDLNKMQTQFQAAITEHCADHACSTPGVIEYGPLAIYRTEYWPKKTGGTYFEYFRADNSEMTFRTINIKSGTRVEGVQVIVKSAKKIYTSNKFGNNGLASSTFNVPAGEYINKIELTYDAEGVTSMVFTTNQDTKSQKFGASTESYKVIQLKGKLVGIYGYASAQYIYSIGFISSEQTYDTSSLSAVIYDGTANDGVPMTLARGDIINDLGLYSFMNRLSSMEVYSFVRVCSAVNFGGTCDYFGTGTYSQKRIKLSNHVASIGAIEPSQIGAIAYLDRNYRGDSLYILKDESIADLSVRGWDKRISSIRLLSWIKACTEVNFGGSCRYFSPSNGNQSYVGDFLNENIQSIRVYDPDSIVGAFFADTNYKGSRFVMGVGESIPDLTSNGFDNMISSFKMFGGADILVCNDINFSGYCAYIKTGSAVSLPKALDNKISSIMFGNNRNRDISLSNYWPIKNNFIDIVGTADLTNHGAALVSDRFENAVSAIRVQMNVAYLTGPTGVYFNGEFSISVWVRPTDNTDYANIRILEFCNIPDADGVFFYVFALRPKIVVMNGNNYVIDEYFGGSIPYGQWSHIGVSISATRIRYFINGEVVTDKENNGHLPASVSRKEIVIGNGIYKTYPKDTEAISELDELKIYSVALGANDIKMEYQESRRSNSASYHWPLYNSDVSDIINGADLLNPVNAGLTFDRYGTSNSALKLTGGYYSAPTSKYFGDQGFTITVWIKPTSDTTGTFYSNILDFITYTDVDSDIVLFSYAYDSSLTPYYNYIANGQIVSQIIFNKAIPLDKWTHLALTVSPTLLTAYINGVNINSAANNRLPPNKDYFYNFIGSSHYSNVPKAFMALNDLKIYNTVLNANDVLTEYTETAGRLVYFWQFNNDVTDVIQAGVMTNPVNAIKTTDRFGNANSAINLNNGGYTLPSGTYFSGEFSISMWVRPLQTTSQTLAKILEIGNGVANDNVVMYLAFNDDQLRPYISYYYNGGEVANLRSTQALALNDWAHVVFTVSSSKISVFINGVLIVDKSNLEKRLPKSIQRTNTLFGSNVSGYNKPKADFDDLKIFNMALSTAQVFQEYRKR